MNIRFGMSRNYLFSICNINCCFKLFFNRHVFKNASVYGITFGFTQSIVFFAYAATFRFGAWLVSEGRMDFEDVFK